MRLKHAGAGTDDVSSPELLGSGVEGLCKVIPDCHIGLYKECSWLIASLGRMLVYQLLRFWAEAKVRYHDVAALGEQEPCKAKIDACID